MLTLRNFSLFLLINALSMVLTACSFWSHKQRISPVEVNPIVVPEDVPPIKFKDYYEAPEISDPAKIKQPSMLPPGSTLSKQQNGK